MPISFLRKFLWKIKDGDRDKAKISGYWNKRQKEMDQAANKWADWGSHPTLLNLIYQDLFGSKDIDFPEFLKKEYGWLSDSRVLSLCCGDGGYEKLLVEREVFGHVTGIDMAGERVAKANNSRGACADELQFETGDVNEGEFGRNLYDVVFAKSSLHHVERLEVLMRGVAECLKPGGCLIALDFFGPSRFQWKESQLDAAKSFLTNEIPFDLLTRPDGKTHEIVRPTIAQMIDSDPSEAVRSAEILDIIRKHFKDLRIFNIGGTLLHLIFDAGIINNFDENNDEHNAILIKAYFYEKKLILEKRIDCDFKFVIAENH